MDGLMDDLIRIARRCDRASKPLTTGPLHKLITRMNEMADKVGQSWSGSNIGHHSTIYLRDFKPAAPGEFFDREWGCEGGHLSRTSGEWVFTTYEQVKDEICRLAGTSDFAPLIEAANEAEETFGEAKEELLPIFDAALSNQTDRVIMEASEKLKNLPSHFELNAITRLSIPSGQFMTRDSSAMSGGIRPAHHIVFLAWILEQGTYGTQVAELAKVARHVSRYLGHKLQMRGTSVAKTDGKIFLGHGGSPAWREVALFIKNRLGLDYDEFNRQSSAGKSNKERLLEMLENACFAFLIMTAEDMDSEGKLHARENVIHEAGLFQGRYGFERAIIVLENGCEEFSNIEGIGQLRFDKGKIGGIAEQIRTVLEREKIIKV